MRFQTKLILGNISVVAALCLFIRKQSEEPLVLNEFRKEEYEISNVQHPLERDNCREITTLTPHFMICVHNATMDSIVSGIIQSGMAWETHVAQFISDSLDNYPGSVFVDIGANIGSHTLFVAAKGNRVWAVEPLTINLLQMYRSAANEGTLGRIHLLQHVVDRVRGPRLVRATLGNIGGSHVVNDDNITGAEEVKAVLLSDIFQAILLSEKANTVVVVKIDIESFECRALLGSPGIFNMTFVPYVIMEWHFAKMSDRRKFVYPENCPAPMVTELTSLFTSNGYSAYGEVQESSWVKLKEEDSLYWKPTNVVWKHKDAK